MTNHSPRPSISTGRHKIDFKAPNGGADFSRPPGGNRKVRLMKKMHEDGFCIAEIARELSITKINIQHFLSGRFDKIGRATRRRIYQFFVDHGWLSRPNRKPPVCKRCGLQYPTRNHHHGEVRAIHQLPDSPSSEETR